MYRELQRHAESLRQFGSDLEAELVDGATSPLKVLEFKIPLPVGAKLLPLFCDPDKRGRNFANDVRNLVVQLALHAGPWEATHELLRSKVAEKCAAELADSDGTRMSVIADIDIDPRILCFLGNESPNNPKRYLPILLTKCLST